MLTSLCAIKLLNIRRLQDLNKCLAKRIELKIMHKEVLKFLLI